MANTIDVVLVTGIEDSGVAKFVSKCGLELLPLEVDGAGGCKVLCLEVYAYSSRTTGNEYGLLKKAFYETEFDQPELVSLIIYDEHCSRQEVLTCHSN